MKTDNQPTVGQIVAENYKAASIFKNFGVDFCCGGDLTVEKACTSKGVDAEQVKAALAELRESGSTDQQNYNAWGIDFLTDYIINNHHSYVRSKCPEIAFYSKKVALVHGSRHPELIKIHELFAELKEELIEHSDKEEDLLFPYIKELVEVQKNGSPVKEKPAFDSAEDPIAMLEEEHEAAGRLMEEIRKLSSDFSLPDDACATYTALYKNLEDFESDLHKHVHLENNILFPKALKLEKQLHAA